MLRSENSRADPSGKQVSVKYNVRKPKYYLLKSKDELVANFKNEYPSCSFKASVIKREMPQNAVKPTTGDCERNTCPIHSNIRRKVKAVNKDLKRCNIPTLPVSVRELCLQSMCASDASIDLLTWGESCALQICNKCPKELKLSTVYGIRKRR